MPRFSKQSLEKLFTCDYRLQLLFLEVIKHVDCIVLEGRRGKERQDILFNSGKTKLKYPHSKHNREPSLAVDVAPYPLIWPARDVVTDSDWRKYVKDVARFYAFGGFVLGVASQLKINIRWGGDWDGNWRFDDQKFDDLVHFELIEG